MRLYYIAASIILVLHPLLLYGAEAEVDLVERLLPQYASGITVCDIERDHGREVFELETVDGELHIRGSSGVAIASGLNYYLRRYAGGMFSWGADQLDLGEQLPILPNPVRQIAPHTVVYNLNYTTAGYTTPYWDWPRWQRELDFMAAQGTTHFLLTVGLSQVYLNTFAQFGYDEQEIRDWLVPPAHQPWQWMGNMHSEGDAVSFSLWRRRAQLGRRIADRARELGMVPVLPGYYGLVPLNFSPKNSGATVLAQGAWAGGYQRPSILLPDEDSTFRAVALEYYQNLERIFGPSNFYSADPFHEGGKTAGVDLVSAMRSVQSAMLQANPEAIWVLQAWQANPQASILAGLNRDKILVIDLNADTKPAWLPYAARGAAPFMGAPWVWSIISNWGGNTTMSGNLQRIADQYRHQNLASQGKHYPPAFSHPAKGNLVGLGRTAEGFELNPIIEELMGEMAWRQPAAGAIVVSKWIDDYTKRRYGKYSTDVQTAWRIMLETVYQDKLAKYPGGVESIFAAFPTLDAQASVQTWGPPGVIPYDSAKLELALKHFLSAGDLLGDSALYRYDLVDLARQVLANRGRALLAAIEAAYNNANQQQFEQLSVKFLALMEDQDELLASQESFLLGKWIQSARGWGESPKESDILELDARSILTTWKVSSNYIDDVPTCPRNFLKLWRICWTNLYARLELKAARIIPGTANNLDDYAHREWAGLVGDYYRGRWEIFFHQKTKELARDSSTSASELDTSIREFSANWIHDTDPEQLQYPAYTVGDSLEIARRIFNNGQLVESIEH